MRSLLPQLRNSWLNLLSFTLIAVSAMMWLVGPSFAQEGSTSGSSASSEDEKSLEKDFCLETIKQDVLEEEQKMVDFLSQHFEQEDVNSELVDEAMDELIAYRDRLRELYNAGATTTYNEDAQEERTEINECAVFVDQHFKLVEVLLRDLNIQTASGKTSFTLVSKLKEINEGLRELNRNFGDMYGGFRTLSDKLPGITK